MLRGHIQEMEGNRRKLRQVNMVNVFPKNEYRIFKPVEITIKRGQR
jgi:hypothetical protein